METEGFVCRGGLGWDFGMLRSMGGPASRPVPGGAGSRLGVGPRAQGAAAASRREERPSQELFLLPPSGAWGETGIGRGFSRARAEKAAPACEGADEASSSGRGAVERRLLRLLGQCQVAGAEAACGVSKILYFTFDILFRSIWIP